MKAVALLFILSFGTFCGFAQVRKQRLIAIGQYHEEPGAPAGTLSIQDSVTLSYSGGRGSAYDPVTMDYFNPNSYYGPRTTLEPTLIERINKLVAPNNLDSDEYALRTAFDSMHHYSVYGSVATLTATEGATYFPDGKYASAWFKSAFKSDIDEINRSFIYYYDRLIREHVEFKGGRQDGSGDRFIIYDAFGNPVLDSTHTTGNRPQLLYSPYRRVYDNNGRYTRLYQDYGIDRSYIYHPDGRVYDLPNRLSNFTYTPGVYGPTGWQYVDPGRLYKPQDAYVHLNAAGLKDTIIYTYIDSLNLPYPPVVQVITTIVYNSYGNPVTKTTSSGIRGYSNLPKSKSNFYYELYDAPLSIESPVLKAGITLSPNPTARHITLHYSAGIPKQLLSVAITNTLGQRVHTESFVPKGNTTDLVLGEGIVPGIYYITVSGIDAVVCKGSFLKQ